MHIIEKEKRKYKTEAGITEVSSIREALNGQNKSLVMRKKKRKKVLGSDRRNHRYRKGHKQ